jgi:hypothetical protein
MAPNDAQSSVYEVNAHGPVMYHGDAPEKDQYLPHSSVIPVSFKHLLCAVNLCPDLNYSETAQCM